MWWIKLYRGLLDSDIWNTGETFTKGQAWVDLLLLANADDVEQIVGYDLVKVPRGSYMTTIRELSDRWKWSKSKVANFLHFLETLEMVRVKSDTKRTLITIVKYGDYQDAKDMKRTKSGHKADTERTQKGNLLYKDRVIDIKSKREDNKTAYGEFGNVYLTSDEYTKLCEKISNIDSLIEKLSLYIESTGKKYKSHYATLLNWDRKDNEGKKAAGGNQTSNGGYFNAASYVASTIFEGEGLNEIRGD